MIFTASSLKRKRDSSAKSYGRISAITAGMDMISMPDLLTNTHGQARGVAVAIP